MLVSITLHFGIVAELLRSQVFLLPRAPPGRQRRVAKSIRALAARRVAHEPQLHGMAVLWIAAVQHAGTLRASRAYACPTTGRQQHGRRIHWTRPQPAQFLARRLEKEKASANGRIGASDHPPRIALSCPMSLPISAQVKPPALGELPYLCTEGCPWLGAGEEVRCDDRQRGPLLFSRAHLGPQNLPQGGGGVRYGEGSHHLALRRCRRIIRESCHHVSPILSRSATTNQGMLRLRKTSS
jgi:hypothetical protein